MKNIIFPDYNKCLMNISTSIIKHYGAGTKFSTLPILDNELDKDYRNVVVILVDAMGSEILKKHQNESVFLRSYQVDTLTSVFPSTTVAATISLLTARPPVNTGWIGWLQYIKEEDRSVIFFFNEDFYDSDHKFDYNVSERYVPVTKIYDLIEEKNNNVTTKEIFPEFRVPEHKEFKDICNSIVRETKEEGKHFIYAYWDKLDTYLHQTGTESLKVKKHIQEIDKNIRDLFNELGDDSIVIITADHGQIDIEEVLLWDYSDITETFKHNPSIEARATAFFIKDGLKEQFVNNFNKHFRDSFILYKSEDFLNSKLLGDDVAHKKINEFIGDYVAIAIDKYSFKLANSKRGFMAQHAGLTKDEMLIPLIVYSPKK